MSPHLPQLIERGQHQVQQPRHRGKRHQRPGRGRDPAVPPSGRRQRRLLLLLVAIQRRGRSGGGGGGSFVRHVEEGGPVAPGNLDGCWSGWCEGRCRTVDGWVSAHGDASGDWGGGVEGADVASAPTEKPKRYVVWVKGLPWVSDFARCRVCCVCRRCARLSTSTSPTLARSPWAC